MMVSWLDVSFWLFLRIRLVLKSVFRWELDTMPPVYTNICRRFSDQQHKLERFPHVLFKFLEFIKYHNSVPFMECYFRLMVFLRSFQVEIIFQTMKMCLLKNHDYLQIVGKDSAHKMCGVAK